MAFLITTIPRFPVSVRFLKFLWWWVGQLGVVGLPSVNSVIATVSCRGGRTWHSPLALLDHGLDGRAETGVGLDDVLVLAEELVSNRRDKMLDDSLSVPQAVAPPQC